MGKGELDMWRGRRLYSSLSLKVDRLGPAAAHRGGLLHRRPCSLLRRLPRRGGLLALIALLPLLALLALLARLWARPQLREQCRGLVANRGELFPQLLLPREPLAGLALARSQEGADVFSEVAQSRRQLVCLLVLLRHPVRLRPCAQKPNCITIV
jgi:hypothetical protein